jgi:hypothetical protein
MAVKENDHNEFWHYENIPQRVVVVSFYSHDVT